MQKLFSCLLAITSLRAATLYGASFRELSPQALSYCERITQDLNMSPKEALRKLYSDAHKIYEDFRELERRYHSIELNNQYSDAEKSALYGGQSKDEFWIPIVSAFTQKAAQQLTAMFPELELRWNPQKTAFTVRADKTLLQKYESPLIEKLVLAQNLNMETVFDPWALIQDGSAGGVLGNKLYLSTQAVTLPFASLNTESHELLHALFRHNRMLGFVDPVLTRVASFGRAEDVSTTGYGRLLHGQEHYTFLEDIRNYNRDLEEMLGLYDEVSPVVRTHIYKTLDEAHRHAEDAALTWETIYQEKHQQLDEILEGLGRSGRVRLKTYTSTVSHPEYKHFPEQTEIKILDEEGNEKYSHVIMSQDRLGKGSLPETLRQAKAELEELRKEFLAQQSIRHNLNTRLRERLLTLKPSTYYEQLSRYSHFQRQILQDYFKVLRPHRKSGRLYEFEGLDRQGQRLAMRIYFLQQQGVPQETLLKLAAVDQLAWADSLSSHELAKRIRSAILDRQ